MHFTFQAECLLKHKFLLTLTKAKQITISLTIATIKLFTHEPSHTVIFNDYDATRYDIHVHETYQYFTIFLFRFKRERIR